MSTSTSLVASSLISSESKSTDSRQSSLVQRSCLRALLPKKTPRFNRIFPPDRSGLSFTKCFSAYSKRFLQPQPLTRDAPIPFESGDETEESSDQ